MITLITTCTVCNRTAACLKHRQTSVCADCLFMGLTSPFIYTFPEARSIVTSDLATLLASSTQFAADGHFATRRRP